MRYLIYMIAGAILGYTFQSKRKPSGVVEWVVLIVAFLLVLSAFLKPLFRLL